MMLEGTSLGAGTPDTRPTTLLDKWYIGLLWLLIFSSATELVPWTQRSAFNVVSNESDGSPLRQFVYLSLTVAAVFPILFTLKIRKPTIAVYAAVAIFGWFSVSVLWSTAPEIALRRLLLAISVGITAVTIANRLDPDQLISALSKCLGCMMILSIFTAVFMPDLGVHQYGDRESQTMGAWRGIFFHKNTLGVIAAISVLIFSYLIWVKKSVVRYGYIFIIASTFCLILSGSKTSAIMTVFAIFSMLILNMHYVGRLKSSTLAIFLILVLSFSLLYLAYAPGTLISIFLDEQNFTGRVLIWQLSFRIIEDNFLLGLGYQSAFQVGISSAFNDLTGSVFLRNLAHAHNGYIDVLMSTGIVGLILVFCFALLVPLIIYTRSTCTDISKVIYAALLVFIGLHQILEAGLGDRDRFVWVLIMLIVVSIGRSAARPTSLAGICQPQ